jgi:N-dimethylarginine dimethylaminohydrolase
MKLEFDAAHWSGLTTRNRASFEVHGETARLRRVLLCAPDHLKPVPCCSVTRESLRDGFAADTRLALQQHAALRAELQGCGVEVDFVPPIPGLPDLCFSRDVAVTTPWGLVALNPALGHRAAEVEHLKTWARERLGAQIDQVTSGAIEGGDVCIARPGLLIIGVSGNRTDEVGAEAFAARFRREGWDVLRYRFDEHFLHLDTIFTMLRPDLALGCVEVLEDSFVDELAQRGIRLIPVTYKESRQLGCNVVSIDGRTVIAGAATPRVSAAMREAGLAVIETDLSQFAACGGGVHCLTLPLVRTD